MKKKVIPITRVITVSSDPMDTPGTMCGNEEEIAGPCPSLAVFHVYFGTNEPHVHTCQFHLQAYIADILVLEILKDAGFPPYMSPVN